jgi:cyclopropane fatty-acyl-phospholipid synthase-like methyltransferase
MANGAAAQKIAESYYDSEDADNFYAQIWGGEDIHIGLYEDPPGDIREASRRTVQYMAGLLKRLTPESRVLDIGAGYGGAARYLAATYGCHVTCLNLSEVENERNRAQTAEQGLSEHVRVLHGSFEHIPEADASFDFVWSQDAILHSGHREQVLDEVARVLKPGGEFIFTDPMQADDIPDPAALQPIYDRLSLPNLASIGFYTEALQQRGFEPVDVVPMLDQLRRHYARVRAELTARRVELADAVSIEYIERMLTGLQHWIDGADSGLLAWGVLHFRKS